MALRSSQGRSFPSFFHTPTCPIGGFDLADMTASGNMDFGAEDASGWQQFLHGSGVSHRYVVHQITTIPL